MDKPSCQIDWRIIVDIEIDHLKKFFHWFSEPELTQRQLGDFLCNMEWVNGIELVEFSN